MCLYFDKILDGLIISDEESEIFIPKNEIKDVYESIKEILEKF